MSTVSFGVFNMGLLWTLIGIGSGIAVCGILLDQWLKSIESEFLTPLLAVAVGIYLPWHALLQSLLVVHVGNIAGRALTKKSSVRATDNLAN